MSQRTAWYFTQRVGTIGLFTKFVGPVTEKYAKRLFNEAGKRGDSAGISIESSMFQTVTYSLGIGAQLEGRSKKAFEACALRASQS